MMKYNLIPHSNFYGQIAEKFDFDNPPIDPIQLSYDLSETLLSTNHLSLSAPSVGLPLRIIVIKSEQMIVIFNPKIVHTSDEEVRLEESCIDSNLVVKIKRPKSIRIRYTQPNGTIVTRTFDGITSRLIQHEISHLLGENYLNKANRVHLDQAKRKLKNS